MKSLEGSYWNALDSVLVSIIVKEGARDFIFYIVIKRNKNGDPKTWFICTSKVTRAPQAPRQRGARGAGGARQGPTRKK